MAGGELEKRLAPDWWKRMVDVSQSKSPIAAEVGNALPQLAAANPAASLRSIGGLLRATPTLTRYTPAQLAQLANVGGGAAVGAGSALGEDLMAEQRPSAADMAKKALVRGAAGLLGAEPNALGTRLSFGQWKPTSPTPDNWAGAAPVARDAMDRFNMARAADDALPIVDAEIVPGAAETEAVFAQQRAAAGTQESYTPRAPRGIESGTKLIDGPVVEERTQPQQPDSLQLGATTDEWDKLISEVGGRVYKADVETGLPKVMAADKTVVDPVTGQERFIKGEEVAGKTILSGELSNNLIQLGKKAGIDTGPHEILHGVINDVLKRGTPGEQRFARRVLEAAGGEEAFVQEGGQEFVRRLIAEAGGTKSGLMSDLTAFVRAKLGRATPADLRALAANTLRHGAGAEPYRPNAPGARPAAAVPPTQTAQPTEGEKSPKKPIVGEERTQPLENNVAPTEERTQPLGPRESYGPEAVKRKWYTGTFASSVDQLRRTGDVRRAQAADVFQRAFSARDAMKGKYGARLLGEISADPATAREAYEAMITRERTQTPPAGLSAKAQAIYNEMDRVYRQIRLDQIAAGHMRAGGSVPRVDPTGMFNLMASEMRNLLTHNQDSPAWARARDEFIGENTARILQHSKNKSPADAQAEATAAFERFIDGVGREDAMANAVDFGAVSLPEGMKLPESWIEPDPFRAWEKFIDRTAKARAWHDVVQADPQARALFEGERALSKDPMVVDLFNSYRDAVPYSPSLPTSAQHLVNSMILGPITRMADLGTTPFKMLQFTPVTQWPAAVASLSDIANGYRQSFETSLNRRGGDLLRRQVLGAHGDAANILDQATKVALTYQGLEKIEVLSRAVAQTMGTTVGDMYRVAARNGDKEALAFLNSLGTDWQSVDAATLGKRIAELAVGRYDARGTPQWQRQGKIAPFFSLMRWSTEQWNNFRNYAIAPAARGNYEPLMRWALASALGGSAVLALREFMTGKKPYVAEIEEIKNAPDKDRAMQEAMIKLGTTLQAVGALGVPGDALLLLGRSATGKLASGPGFPAMEVAADTVERTWKALTAIFSGVPADKVLWQVAKDTAQRNFQATQIISQLTDLAGVDEKNLMRDYRMFRRLSGENDVTPLSSPDYRRVPERQLDAARTPAEVDETARAAVAEARRVAGDDRVKFMSELRKLLNDRISWAPSDPRELSAYVQYLEQTQGQEKARQFEDKLGRARELQKDKKRAVMNNR
jgi:hypothetical protein